MGQKETFGSYGYVYDIDCDDGFMGIYLSPNTKLYTLNTYTFLYVHHTSIKQFFKKYKR